MCHFCVECTHDLVGEPPKPFTPQKRDMAESEDFPQPEDIEPTVKGFADTMDILDRLCEERED